MHSTAPFFAFLFTLIGGYKTMKKIIAIVLSAALLLSICIFASCKKDDPSATTGEQLTDETNKDKKISIVTTIFPIYDWVRELLGEKASDADITMLLNNGVDLHSYQPSAEDIVKISKCDMFIYVGGESDGWVDSVLKNADNKNMKVINLLDSLGDAVKTEEVVEGMQEEEHGHSHGHEEEITKDDIKDRTLTDFSGEWKSLYPYLLNGELDEYCEHKAEEDDDSASTKETYIEKYKASWKCDVEKIKIDGNKITFTYSDGKTVSADYSYAGYQPKENDNGEINSVRYQFKTDSADAPKYVQFNDHGHEPGEAEHFHIYFGNDGFDSLTKSKTNPFFVKNALSTEEILDELMGHDHEEEKDEHVWLSVKNAKVLCGKISDALKTIDPTSKDAIEANTSSYLEKLTVLDGEYKKAVDAAKIKTVLFGDRFPFRYLVDDYGLKYYAAFVGCSAESEASFETVSFLAKKVDELKLPCVLTIEGATHKIAETIVQTTAEKNQKILTMDSMQSTTAKDIENGKTYYAVMEKNLSVLKEALA